MIPTLNEARNLAVVLPSLPRRYDIVVVDGGSTDETETVVRQVRPDSTFIRQSRTGKGNALVCGFHVARGDVIVMFDADGSADPAEIPRFVQALRAGADFAKGSRVLGGGGSADITRIRGIGNRALTGLASLLFGVDYTDLCYGYNAFWRDVLPLLDLPDPVPPVRREMREGDGFEIETLLNCRVAVAELAVVEVPSFELDRVHGVSNLDAIADGRRVLKTMVSEYLRKRRVERLLAHQGELLSARRLFAQRQQATMSSAAPAQAARRAGRGVGSGAPNRAAPYELAG
ncbi:MAG: glycosyltransferase family 2 protein [Desertimonas sp.]